MNLKCKIDARQYQLLTTGNHFGRLVGICAANRVFVRYFGVVVDDVLEDTNIFTHITALVDAKQAQIVTEYYIPNLFPGVPGMFRPPIMFAMALALAVAVPIALLSAITAVLLARHSDAEAEAQADSASERDCGEAQMADHIALAGVLAVVPRFPDDDWSRTRHWYIPDGGRESLATHAKLGRAYSDWDTLEKFEDPYFDTLDETDAQKQPAFHIRPVYAGRECDVV